MDRSRSDLPNVRHPWTTAGRPFTLLDAMVLVAALAVGFGVMRSLGVDQVSNLSTAHSAYLPVSRLVMRGVEATPCLATVSLALLGLALKGRTTRFRRLVRRPGFVACGATAVALVLGMVPLEPLFAALGRASSRVYTWETMENILAAQAGVGVATGWLLLACAGIWRAEPHWIDRAGRVVGGLWIALTLGMGFVVATGML